MRSLRLGLFTTTLTLLFIYGATLGITHEQLGGPFLSHCFEAIFAIVLFTFGRTCQWRQPEVFLRGISLVARWVLLAHITIMAIFFIFYSMGKVYLGMSASVLTLSAIVMLREKRIGMAMLAMALLLMTGKRGDLLGLVTAGLTYMGMTGRMKNVGRGVLVIVGIILMVTVLAVGLRVALNLDLFDAITSKLEVLSKLDFSQLDSDATRQAIGGRGMEIFVIYDALFTHGFQHLLIGLGYGWSLPIIGSDVSYNEIIHNVHVTPFDTIAQYGLGFAVVWWFAVLKTIQYGFYRGRNNPTVIVLLPYATAMVAITMTAYAVSVDPLFWIAMGAISLPVFRSGTAGLDRCCRRKIV